MRDDESIIQALRDAAPQLTPVQLAELLGVLLGKPVSQGAIVTYFKRAYSAIPLGVLLEATAWNRVSDGALTDELFNELLAPWLTHRS